MNIAFYTAAAGMITQQDGLNIYSNNISNVNTVGYKALRPSFADCIYTIQRETEQDWQTGHGTYVNKTDFMWDEGSFSETGQELDFALPNSDFFMVLDGRGDTYLTRDGSFEITQVDDHWELVNGNGEFVLDYEGNHITVPFLMEEQQQMVMDDEGNPVLDEDGNNVYETVEVQTSKIDYDTLTDMIGLYSVPNNWGLRQGENNHFVVTASSGDPVADENADKIRKYLEMSTTDLAGDMVHVIESQRAYQLNAKIVQTADEMQSIANNLRG